jgi:hypothetical protein
MIPPKDHQGLVVVVNKYDGSQLDIGMSGKIHLQLKGTLNVPSILSANEVGSHLKHFYCLNENKLGVLCITYKDGLPLDDVRDFAGQIDNVIRQHSCTMFTLLSLDKVIPPEEMESGRFNYFVRQFGGNGLPNVDKSFHTVNDVPGLKLSYKMVDAREYIAYPPLSVGFFQSSSLMVQIQQSFIRC